MEKISNVDEKLMDEGRKLSSQIDKSINKFGQAAIDYSGDIVYEMMSRALGSALLGVLDSFLEDDLIAKKTLLLSFYKEAITVLEAVNNMSSKH